MGLSLVGMKSAAKQFAALFELVDCQAILNQHAC